MSDYESTGRYELSGIELESPLLNAAGSINGPYEQRILHEVDLLASTAIGAITVGSFTTSPQEGNEAKYGSPVYYHDAKNGRTYNSMGLPNIGLDRAVALAPQILQRAHESGSPVIFSGSPYKSDDVSSVRQASILAYELLETNVDMVELNVSCPNVVVEGGERKPIMGYDVDSMAELIKTLKDEVGEGHDLGVKLPPYLTEQQRRAVPQLAKLLRATNVFSFLVTSNTIPHQIPVDEAGEPILSVPDGKGGMSGPDTKYVGRDQLALWAEEIESSLDIVSTLGVDSGKEIDMRLHLGATAAAGVDFLWESKSWTRAVNKILDEYAELT